MWFCVDLFFRSSRPDRGGPLWEERLLIFEATDEADAKEAGERAGKAGEHAYRIASGAKVAWVFDRVAAVRAIEDMSLTSGVEVFARFLRDAEARSLLTPFED